MHPIKTAPSSPAGILSAELDSFITNDSVMDDAEGNGTVQPPQEGRIVLQCCDEDDQLATHCKTVARKHSTVRKQAITSGRADAVNRSCEGPSTPSTGCKRSAMFENDCILSPLEDARTKKRLKEDRPVGVEPGSLAGTVDASAWFRKHTSETHPIKTAPSSVAGNLSVELNFINYCAPGMDEAAGNRTVQPPQAGRIVGPHTDEAPDTAQLATFCKTVARKQMTVRKQAIASGRADAVNRSCEGPSTPSTGCKRSANFLHTCILSPPAPEDVRSKKKLKEDRPLGVEHPDSTGASAQEHGARDGAGVAAATKVQELSSCVRGEKGELYYSILRDAPKRLGLLTARGKFKKMKRHHRYDHLWTPLEQQKECERVASAVHAIVLNMAKEPWARTLTCTNMLVGVAWDIYGRKGWPLLV